MGGHIFQLGCGISSKPKGICISITEDTFWFLYYWLYLYIPAFSTKKSFKGILLLCYVRCKLLLGLQPNLINPESRKTEGSRL